MKRTTRDRVLLALAIVCTMNSMPVLAIDGKPAFVPSNAPHPASDRLIVKLRAKTAQVMSVSQIRAELSKPFSVQVLQQLQGAAGVAMSDLHATGNGAHVMMLHGVQNRQTVAQAIAGISKLPNVEYVEEDVIETVRMAPTDPYYTFGIPATSPGLWGMWPAAAASSPASLGTGSYGADFETAWNSATGTGVVVAVVDTGITPHVDIVGPGGVVAAGAGSNLVSTGYDFIRDCRVRGSCPATWSSASAVVAASPDATDTGDFLDATDCAAGSFFYPCTPSNSSWHGTHVAGTIAAIGNNGVGVIGGAFGAKILPVRALGKGGGYSSDVSDAIMWAAGAYSTITNPTPAKVINLSLGSTNACSVTRQNAINAAVAAGAVVVVAAGNESQDVANSSAANCQNVISVAAVARDGSRASYSNFSSPASNITNPTNVTLAAPGGDANGGYPATFEPGILSTLNTATTTPATSGGSNYVYYSGTSMATPHVSAAVALMLAHNSALTPAQVRTILSSPSSLTAFPSFSAASATWDCALNKNCGAGILNANLAVQNSAPAALTAAATTDFGAASVNTTVSKTVTLTNGSGTSVTTGTATVDGNNAAFFSITADTCSAKVIAAAATCQITVRYAPTAAGVHTATLMVPDTTSPTTLRTFVALTGAAGSQLATTTPSVTAATVTAGQSTTVNLSYRNPNWIALPVGAVILSQPSIMAASADGCSNTTLAAGASCAVTVTITPTAGGSYNGTASLGVSGGGTPAVATISGSATAPPSSGGGGGCSVMPAGANPDVSLLLAMLAVAAYRLRRRAVRGRSAD